MPYVILLLRSSVTWDNLFSLQLYTTKEKDSTQTPHNTETLTLKDKNMFKNKQMTETTRAYYNLGQLPLQPNCLAIKSCPVKLTRDAVVVQMLKPPGKLTSSKSYCKTS